MLTTSHYLSPLGQLTIVADDVFIKGIWFKEQKYYGMPYDIEMIPMNDNQPIKEVKQWLDAYFSGENPKMDASLLAPDVTEFRQKVLDIMIDIPYGETLSYGEIANRIERHHNEKKCSARAVGGAVGHNPISILIPCHRVIGSDGSLTGYAGGIEKKIGLLTLEGILNGNED